jgi:hypothetical protein
MTTLIMAKATVVAVISHCRTEIFSWVRIRFISSESFPDYDIPRCLQCSMFAGWSEQALHSEHKPDGGIVMEAVLLEQKLGQSVVN